MRVAIVEAGVVTGVVMLDAAMVIDADGSAARGPAKMSMIDGAGNVSEHDYEAIFPAPTGGKLIQSDTAGVGNTWTPDGFVEPAKPAGPVNVPPFITDRQFFQQLAIAGIITQTEALDAVKTGTLPKALSDMVATLPQAQQFNAEMLLSGATTFMRNNSLTNAFGALQNMTADQIDAFFVAAAKL